MSTKLNIDANTYMEDSQRRSRELEQAQPDGIVSPDAEYHTAVEPKPSSVLRPVDVNIITAPSPVTPLAIKKKRKGRRKLFDRRKYDINKRRSISTATPSTLTSNTPESVLEEPNSSLVERYHPSVDFLELVQSLKNVELLTGWTIAHNEETINVYKMRLPQPTVEQSITITANLSWQAHVMGRLIPQESCTLFNSFPEKISNVQCLQDIVKAIDESVICPGNADCELIELFEQRGCFTDDHCTAYVDIANNASSGTHFRTIRHRECEFMCSRSGKFPHICSACQTYRGTLRVMKWRASHSADSSRTAHNSHTNIRFLSEREKEDRLRNIQLAKRNLMTKNRKLQERLQQDIEMNGVSSSDPESDEVANLVRDTTGVAEDFPKNSVQYILWEEQKKYNALKDKHQMRWHPLVIRFALSLKYASTAAYQQVTKLGFLALPSERSLRDYTHWCNINSGVQTPFINQMKEAIKDEGINGSRKKFCLLMDEMKIKGGLAFSKSSGKLVGFSDLGTINSEMDDLCSYLSGDQHVSRSAELASHMLVFMVRPVFRPSWCFTVATYPSSNITGDRLYPIVWKVIEALELNFLPIVSVTSDGASSNRRFYRLCKVGGISHKTRNPFDLERYIYFFCDTPHLLKTARNCFSNSHAHSNTRRLEKNGQSISWKHIESLYLTEMSTTTPGVRICHKLTKYHVWLTPYSKMKVNLAAQVLSETVASALQTLDKDSTTETRAFIRMMDRFFDCLNVKSPKQGHLQRKEYRHPYTSSADHRFKWLKNDFLGYLNEWEESLKLQYPHIKKGERSKRCFSRETLEGLRMTVISFCELGPELIKETGSYLLSEVFSQDPLECYFSRQRNRGGGNDNPTVEQFQKNAAILLQKQQLHWDNKNSNIEPAMQETTERACMQPLSKRHRRV